MSCNSTWPQPMPTLWNRASKRPSHISSPIIISIFISPSIHHPSSILCRFMWHIESKISSYAISPFDKSKSICLYQQKKLFWLISSPLMPYYWSHAGWKYKSIHHCFHSWLSRCSSFQIPLHMMQLLHWTQPQGTTSCMWEIAIARHSKWGMFAAWLPPRSRATVVNSDSTPDPNTLPTDLNTAQERSLSPRLFVSFQRGNKYTTAACEASVN